jgi:peptidoglycan/LPS O-acetylase OafA/YrhL
VSVVRPEMPYLAAGAVAIAGGTAKQGHFPSNGISALTATAVVVVLASATAGTKVAPIVRAIGLLLLMATVMAAVPSLTKQRNK